MKKGTSTKKRVKYSTNHKGLSGKTIQDEIVEANPSWYKEKEDTECPICNHGLVVAEVPDEVHAGKVFNIQAAHNIELMEYSNKSKTEQKVSIFIFFYFLSLSSSS